MLKNDEHLVDSYFKGFPYLLHEKMGLGSPVALHVACVLELTRTERLLGNRTINGGTI